MIQVGRVL